MRARGHKSKPRVVILQPYIAQYRAKFLSELMRLSREKGIELEILAGKATGSQAKRNDDYSMSGVHELKQREWKLLGRRVSIRIIPPRVFTADLVIWEQARRNIDVYAVLVPRRLRPFKAALWGHGADYVGSKTSFDNWLRSLVTRKSDWFFAYSKRGGESVELQGMKQGQISIVFNSTDTRLLKKQIEEITAKDISGFRKELDISVNNTVLFMGGLDSSKRISLVLEVCMLVRAKVPDLSLLICGDGSDRELVEEAASEHNWIKYLGVTVDRRKALALSSARLILNPAPVGLIAVDSLAAGRPIITCIDVNHGPEFEYLDDGETCFVVNDDPETLAMTVRSILADNELLENVATKCLSSAQPLSSETMAQNFFDGIVKSLSL